MMPKGVEHIGFSPRDAWRVAVKIPMMPKGVEHFEMLKNEAEWRE